MSFIDFSPFHQRTGVGALSEALDPVVAAISRWRTRENQRETQGREHAQQTSIQGNQLAFQREVEARRRADSERKQAQAGVRDRAHAEVANAGARQKVIDRVKGRLANQDFSGAETDINNFAQVDPTTNQVQSGRAAIPFEIHRPELGPEPQQPTLEDATPAEPGYSDYHEQADDMSANRAVAQATAGRNAVAMAKYGPQKAAYDERVKRAPLETTVSIGGAPPQSIGDMRYGHAQLEAEDFRQYVEALATQGQGPETRRKIAHANAIGAAVASGKIPAAKAVDMVEKGIAAGEQQDFTGGQGDLNRQNRLDNTALVNQRPQRSFGAMGDPKEEQVKLSRLRMLEQGIDRFQNKFQIPANRQEQHKMLFSLNNEKNTGVQRGMVYNGLARGVSGEKGPLSKDDVLRVQGRLAGALGDFTNWMSELSSGQMGDAKLKVVREAIQAVLEENQQKTKEAMRAFKAGFLGAASPYRKWGIDDFALNRAEEIFGEGAAQELLAPPPGAQNMPIEAGGLVGTGRKKAPKQAAKPGAAAPAQAAAAESPEARAARLEKLLEERGF